MISHTTISHLAAAAPGPQVRRISAHDKIYSFAPPRNKSWRRHCRLMLARSISFDVLSLCEILIIWPRDHICAAC